MNEDWLNVFADILECWGCLEGTWYQGDWRDFGVTEEQEKAIIAAWEKKHGHKYKPLLNPGD